MRIDCITNSKNISYNGLYKKIGTVEKSTGKANLNKVVKFIHEYSYFPFENETKTDIYNAIKKYTIGRNFVLWEKDHGHREGLYYIMNHITVANTIKEQDKTTLMKMDYFEKPIGGVQEYKQFMDTYNNEAYGTMDVVELGKDYIDEFIKNEKH